MLKTKKKTSLTRWDWKVCLEFLEEAVQDEIRLMSDGSAFQARGPATEKTLSVRPYMKLSTWNDEVAARTGPKAGVITAPDELTDIVEQYHGKMSNIEVHSLNWILLDTGSQWSCVRMGGACVRTRTEAPQRSHSDKRANAAADLGVMLMRSKQR